MLGKAAARHLQTLFYQHQLNYLQQHTLNGSLSKQISKGDRGKFVFLVSLMHLHDKAHSILSGFH